MRFVETSLKGAYVIHPERIHDNRGFFARTFCAKDFAALGLDPGIVQCNLSFNERRGTLRGLHFQASPHAETKLIRCTRGAILDVIVDLRKGSPTLGQHFSIELTETNGLLLYVPREFAHGFQTLVDDTEVSYQMSEFYHADLARGIRWDSLPIQWPIDEKIISDRDRSLPAWESFQI